MGFFFFGGGGRGGRCKKKVQKDKPEAAEIIYLQEMGRTLEGLGKAGAGLPQIYSFVILFTSEIKPCSCFTYST
jgi:hypothetical protein